MYTHLRELQKIADANGGSRANGTPGYDASVDYVAQFLRDKGFDVQTPEFEVLDRTEGGNPQLTIGGRNHQRGPGLAAHHHAAGRAERGDAAAAEGAAGCRAADYGTASMKGAIAVVDDTGCSIVDKQNAAVDRGAVGLLVVSAPGSSGSPAGLFTPGYYQQLTVPVGVIGNDANAALRRTNAPVKLVLDSKPVMKKARNVLAQTKSGDTRERGDGRRAPRQLCCQPRHQRRRLRSRGGAGDRGGARFAARRSRNAVRFALWGSEENSLQGATKYVRGLAPGPTRRDRAVSQPRHDRLTERRVLHLRR